MNCLIGIFYASPYVHGDWMSVTTNCVGLGMELFYLAHFYIFGKNYKNMIKITIVLVLELVYIHVIAITTLTEIETHEERSAHVQPFCIVFGIGALVYAQPPNVMRKMLRGNKVDDFDPCLSFLCFVYSLCWALHAAVYHFDLIILIVNGTGAIWGAFQLLIWARNQHWSAKGMKQECWLRVLIILKDINWLILKARDHGTRMEQECWLKVLKQIDLLILKAMVGMEVENNHPVGAEVEGQAAVIASSDQFRVGSEVRSVETVERTTMEGVHQSMAVIFEDLHAESGLKSLEDFLAGKTYISGDHLTKDDIKVYAAVSGKPDGAYPNAGIWYDCVSSHLAAGFPGKAAGVKIGGSAPVEAVAPAEVAEADDDDLDLFGDETEEEASEEREAAVKASSKKKESGKSSEAYSKKL